MTQSDTFAPGEALRDVPILYADGESHRRDLMRQLLITLGARRIQLAESGMEARRLFRDTSAGLVLVEQKLPDMDATALIQVLRSTRNYPKALVPMLVVGEASKPETVRAALDAGANHFVVKPICPAKLYERMCWALADKRAFAVKDGRYVLAPLARPASNSPKSAAAK
jgi:CheY-like chemotaxis protein